MTVNDLLKRVKEKDYDKVIILSDGEGWSNISNVIVGVSSIMLVEDNEPLFSGDK